ncbi:helix-turn-helix domain-containing protein [Rhodospirillaceae bacterium SYSU D60014]|uniref:helix-turn-helix domain-containing protein n=1 Tax=Virgifigura deserti TaxID=2268457 RepID=UPI000E6674C5
MAADDLPENLKLLCSYSRSVSEACRRMRLNRQQFNKYLVGQSRPSLQTLRRIADHFGLEESELLLNHAAFRRLVAIKRPVTGSLNALSERVRDILLLTPPSLERLREHTGFYYNYFCPAEYPGRILRGFIHVFEDGGFIFSRNMERYGSDPFRSTRKYNGIFVHSGERVLMFEREATVGKMVWLTILYPHDRDQPSLLPGLTLGVTSMSSRDIACYRVILQYLGRHIELKAALRQCGLYDLDDERIDPAIRGRLRNEARPSEPDFAMRI